MPMRVGVYNAGMERRLNSSIAVRIAWSIVGVLALGIGAFVVFLLAPLPGGARGGADQADTALSVAVTPGAPTPASGSATVSGVLERTEGQALIVKTSSGESVRLLLRRGAPVGSMRPASASDLRTGEPAVVTVRRQTDGRLVVVGVRLQPPDLPILPPNGDVRGGGSGPEAQSVTGVIAAIAGPMLRLTTSSGDQVFELSSTARVMRFSPLNAADLQPGQRIAVKGERLIDGSLAALAVQVFDPH